MLADQLRADRADGGRDPRSAVGQSAGEGGGIEVGARAQDAAVDDVEALGDAERVGSGGDEADPTRIAVVPIQQGEAVFPPGTRMIA